MATKADLPQLRRSIASLKGHLTRSLDRCGQFLTDPVCGMTLSQIPIYEAELVKRHGALEEAAYNAGGVDEEEAAFQNKSMAEYEKRVNDARTALRKLHSSITREASASLVDGPAIASRPGAPKQFDVRTLRPFILTKDHTPSEFRLWKEEFYTYFSAYGLEQYAIHTQQGAFRKSLSTGLFESIRDQISMDMSVYSPSSGPCCMRVLEEAFLVFYPAFSRRLEYEETGAEPGETPLPFLKRLTRLCDASDIADVSEKDRIVFKFFQGTPTNGFVAESWNSSLQPTPTSCASLNAVKSRSSPRPRSPRWHNASKRLLALHLPLPQSRRPCLMDCAQRSMKRQSRRSNRYHVNHGNRETGRERVRNLHRQNHA